MHVRVITVVNADVYTLSLRVNEVLQVLLRLALVVFQESQEREENRSVCRCLSLSLYFLYCFNEVIFCSFNDVSRISLSVRQGEIGLEGAKGEKGELGMTV